MQGEREWLGQKLVRRNPMRMHASTDTGKGEQRIGVSEGRCEGEASGGKNKNKKKIKINLVNIC